MFPKSSFLTPNANSGLMRDDIEIGSPLPGGNTSDMAIATTIGLVILEGPHCLPLKRAAAGLELPIALSLSLAAKLRVSPAQSSQLSVPSRISPQVVDRVLDSDSP